MSRVIKEETDMIQAVEAISTWVDQLLSDAPLTALQRDDLTAVRTAAERFKKQLDDELDIIIFSKDEAELQRVRHDLRNHLNIIVGFTRIIVRELPDNLLLHLVTVRNINNLGKTLIECVNEIR